MARSDLREERAVVNDRRARRRRIEIGGRKLAADTKKQQQQRGQQGPREQYLFVSFESCSAPLYGSLFSLHTRSPSSLSHTPSCAGSRGLFRMDCLSYSKKNFCSLL